MLSATRSGAKISKTLVRFGSSAVKFNHSEHLATPQSSLSPAFPEKGDLTETKIHKLPNGVSVASVENGSPVSSLSITIKAGSRYEKHESLGHSLILKNLAFEDTKKRTQIALTRILENSGSSLDVELGREFFTIRANFLRENFEEVSSLVSSIINAPDFSFHRVERSKKAAISDVEHQGGHPESRLLDILHKTAFRSGLGNQLYPAHHVESATPESVQKFASEVFSPSRIAVVATGVSHESLSDACAREFGSLPSVNAPENKTKYYGGETIIAGLDEHNRHIVAYESPSLNSQDKYALLVLQQIIGGQSHVLGGVGSSRLSQNAKGVECFSMQYSDSGLFGFYSKQSANPASLVEKAVGELKKVASSVSDAELSTGKAKAKASALFGSEKRNSTASYLSTHLLSSSTFTTLNDFTNNLDKVTSSDIQKLASSILQSKTTIVSSFD